MQIIWTILAHLLDLQKQIHNFCEKIPANVEYVFCSRKIWDPIKQMSAHFRGGKFVKSKNHLAGERPLQQK